MHCHDFSSRWRSSARLDSSLLLLHCPCLHTRGPTKPVSLPNQYWRCCTGGRAFLCPFSQVSSWDQGRCRSLRAPGPRTGFTTESLEEGITFPGPVLLLLVNCPIWVLGAEFVFSETAASTLSLHPHFVIFNVQALDFFCQFRVFCYLFINFNKIAFLNLIFRLFIASP